MRKNTPVIELDKIVLPIIHIKLNLTTKFPKAVFKEGKLFNHLKEKFPKLSERMLK